MRCRRSARYVRAPHRISILRPARSCESSLLSGAARGLPIKKAVNSRRRCVEARALPAGAGCRRPLGDGPLGPAPDLPDPAGELARHGGVGLAGRLAGARERLAAAVEPGGAVVRPRAYRRGHVGAGDGGLGSRGAHGVVPCGLYERRARECVAGLGYPAAPLGLAARVLRRRQPAPAREGRRRAEPAEGPGLRREPEGRQGVDPLDAGERLHGRPPAVGAGQRDDPPLELPPVRFRAAGGRDVVLERVALRALEPDLRDPPPVGPRPCLLPRPVGAALVPDVAQPDQEHVEALPRAVELAGRVVEGAVEVPGGLDGRVWQRDLDDVVGGEHAGDELGVAPVVLAARVRRRPLHLGDGGHGAVEPEGAQLACHVEPGGAALVARPGLIEAEGPLRDLGGVGAEVAVHHLAGEGVERRRGDRSRVDVQSDGGNMGHGKPPPRRCGKGYRTGRYSKPIVAPRARGKKLRRGGGDPNGFLISSLACNV